MAAGQFLSVLTGSFSTPAGDNPTVAMVEAAYRQLGLDARYLNCEVQPADLGDAVRGARAMGWRGFNCSLPHKVAVIDHLDELAPSADIIGAVNCVVNQAGRLIGENTDGKGFLASLQAVAETEGANVVLLGAGGAARAIAVELALAGARSITVVNRNRTRGAALAALINERTDASATFVTWIEAYRIPEAASIVVNATSIGLPPDTAACPAIDFDTLRATTIVADVIPNPPRTPFLRHAEARGCTTLDGLGMLVNQGVRGIELWTGLTPDRATMQDSLVRLFGAAS